MTEKTEDQKMKEAGITFKDLFIFAPFETACIMFRKFDELAAIQGIPQDSIWHPEGTVDIHTLHVIMAAIAYILEHNIKGTQDAEDILLGALCHDLGKPFTTEEKDGRIISPGHQSAGEAPTRLLLAKMGCPQDQIDRIAAATCEHMAHLNGAGRRTVKRLLGRLNGLNLDVLEAIIIADHSGRPFTGKLASRNEIPGLAEMIDTAKALLIEMEEEANKPAPLITGKDLIEMGIAPGPKMGQLLAELAKAQERGEITNKEEALSLIEIIG